MVDLRESPDAAQAFVDELGITYTVLLDSDGRVADLYRIFAIPAELFLDSEGIIRAKILSSLMWGRLDQILPLIGVEP
jgi:peroxiredoxin